MWRLVLLARHRWADGGPRSKKRIRKARGSSSPRLQRVGQTVVGGGDDTVLEVAASPRKTLPSFVERLCWRSDLLCNESGNGKVVVVVRC